MLAKSNIFNPNNFFALAKNKINNSLLHNAASAITGVKIRLGGRLNNQRITPRFSSVLCQKGSLNRRITNISTSAIITSKNKKGAYSVKVSMGHKFF